METKGTTKDGRAQLHAHVKPEIHAEMAALARANDRSIAAEIRRALDEHVRRERTEPQRAA